MLNTVDKKIFYKEICDILNYLKADEVFDGECEFDEFIYDNEEYFDSLNIKVTHGVTKAVFIFNDADYVIKVPLNNRVDCKREYEVYSISVEKGLSKYFPETDYLGQYKGLPMYIQRKIGTTWEDVPYAEYEKIESELSQEEKELAETKYECEFEGEYTFSAFFIHKNGEEELDKLLWFLDDESVNDLHEGNIGLSMAGEPILCDFSGYCN